MSATAISHYSTSSRGVGGMTKRRISDFLVRERTPEGELCSIEAFSGSAKNILEKEWPLQPKGCDQLIVTLEKFNTDLNHAIRLIARALYTSKKRIGYAGMKDKRAITSQKISIWKPDIEKLKKFRSRYLDIRDATWLEKRIEIGDLEGNEFEVTIRGIALDSGECRKRINQCFTEMQNGIANYFGEQRFGGIREITHLVGKEFVKGNPRAAVMLYLTATTEQEEADIREARLALAQSNDFAEASRHYPVKYRYERAIVHHLCKYPADFAGAFRKLPKALCYMFTHAYQSYLFNMVINRRIEKGVGIKKAEGDILDASGNPTAPLFGFESELASGIPGEIEREVLEEESIRLEDFKVRALPELSSKGARRSIVVFPLHPMLIDVCSDELNEGMVKAILSFGLKKGCYATTVLREIMKNCE